jgi:hypothetical protein
MPGYEVKFQQVGVAGGADLEIRSLLDGQQYSDPLGEAEAAGISPATWPSSARSGLRHANWPT